MQSTRGYNRNYAKRLREKRSRAGKESQRVQALRRQAMAGEWDSFEDIVARAKEDRRGANYRHLVGCDAAGREMFRLVLTHARRPARTDQFRVVEFRRSQWSEDFWTRSVWPEPLAMGSILARYAKSLPDISA